MRMTMGSMLLSLGLLLGACSKSGDEEEPAGAAEEVAQEQVEALQPPEPAEEAEAEEPTAEEVPVFEDFEDEAESQITEANFESQLQQLEAEVESDLMDYAAEVQEDEEQK